MKFRKLVYLAIILGILYYLFIVNIGVTLGVIAVIYMAFKLYKIYKTQTHKNRKLKRVISRK
jgi:DMSO/TMAO reductase YedYZ heme-binding membrane subunit